MNTTVRTYEGRNNTYHVIKSAKTTYEQRRDRRKEVLYMLMQKSFGVIIILTCLIFAFKTHDPEVRGLLTLGILFLGLPVTLTREHVINL